MTTETEPFKILTRTRSLFKDIFVIERENLREMWFQGNGRFYLQTRIDLDCPDDLALIYTRLLLAPLMWNPAPSRILMIGLGGGVLPRFLSEVYPDLMMDVVEVDPRVTELARRFFNFKESLRLRMFEDDGRAFVKQQGHKYDLVFLDAFKGGSVPYHLKTAEFYQEIAQSLTGEGILVTNLYGKSNALKPRDRKTLETVFDKVFIFEEFQSPAAVAYQRRLMVPTLKQTQDEFLVERGVLCYQNFQGLVRYPNLSLGCANGRISFNAVNSKIT